MECIEIKANSAFNFQDMWITALYIFNVNSQLTLIKK